jgi:arylsulfatase A-like enzyme
LILICSDNGCEKGAGQAGILKGYKTHLFEGGIRSSLVAWGPALMPKAALGTRNKDSVFSAIDLVPSLLKLTGAKPAANVQYDGEDVLDTLLGKSKASRQAPIFFGRPPDRKNHYGFSNLPDLAVRRNEWKLLCDFDGSAPQLYNLLTDPGETKNLAADKPKITKEMTQLLTAWYKTMPK